MVDTLKWSILSFYLSVYFSLHSPHVRTMTRERERERERERVNIKYLKYLWLLTSNLFEHYKHVGGYFGGLSRRQLQSDRDDPDQDDPAPMGSFGFNRGR